MENTFALRCKKLRKEGLTLGEIVKATGRPKSSVYFHVRSVSVSPFLREKLKTIQSQKIRGHGPKLGVSRLHRSLNRFQGWQAWSVRLVSHILFDGSVTRKGVAYQNRSSALVEKFCRDMSRVCNFTPRRYFSKEGVYRAAFHNVEMERFWQERERQLIADMPCLKPDFQKEFLKAFFNDEGSVYFNSSSRVRRVTGVQYDHRILHLVKTLLGNFGISSDIDMHTHAVVISGQSNLLRFRKHIGFARGLTVNGTRANSRWKKSLEKRHILNRAIAFYKS